eukprot:2157594-Pleurochrysis_carterae.AAC.1
MLATILARVISLLAACCSTVVFGSRNEKRASASEKREAGGVAPRSGEIISRLSARGGADGWDLNAVERLLGNAGAGSRFGIILCRWAWHRTLVVFLLLQCTLVILQCQPNLSASLGGPRLPSSALRESTRCNDINTARLGSLIQNPVSSTTVSSQEYVPCGGAKAANPSRACAVDLGRVSPFERAAKRPSERERLA